MTNADHMSATATATKEPVPNNPEQAMVFKEATEWALIKFVDCIHSFDHYKNESACQYYTHDYLNEPLWTDQSY